MLTRICNGVSALVEGASWIAFALLIVVVALQVLARNVFNVPMIWTSDMALVLFTWLVFIGAATGLRSGSHYVVDMLPTHRPGVGLFVEVLSLAAAVCVAWILGVHGLALARMRASGEIQSLGISRFWIYFALPVSGWIMALYILEMIWTFVRDPYQLSKKVAAETARSGLPDADAQATGASDWIVDDASVQKRSHDA